MSQASAVISKSEKVEAAPKYAWVILIVAFTASVAAPLNQFKVPPIMPILMEAFNLSMSSAGLLMSVFAITGFILALPAGLILQRLGLKVTGLIAMGCLVIGSTTGALSTSAALMLTSRVIEGVGMGLIAVVAPAAIAMWFPREKQGAPMGIWATWVPVGSVIMYSLAPALAARFGWQSAWWFGSGFSLLAFVLVWLFLRMPPMENEPAVDGNATASDAPRLSEALSNRSIWFLAIAFGCFNMSMLAINTFYPTFLSSVQGYSMANASFTTSLAMVVVIFAAPLAGVISDKIGSRKLILSVALLAGAILFFFPFTITGTLIPAWMIVFGALAGAIPTTTFAAAPEIMGKPQLAGMGMAVVGLGQNLGMVLGPAIFGALIESSGWTTAGYALVPPMIIGLIVAWMVKVR